MLGWVVRPWKRELVDAWCLDCLEDIGWFISNFRVS
jgi:hypothetical protein